MKITLNYSQYQYLKDNNILEQYKTNVKNDNSIDDEEDYSDDSNFIDSSFIWSDTPEGHDFWSDHDNKSEDLKSLDLYTLEL